MRVRKNSFAYYLVFGFRIILLVILFPFILSYILFKNVSKNRAQRANRDKVKIYDMQQIDLLTGTEFEYLLKEVFENLGYEATITKSSYDYGADLVLKRKNQISVVQAKCYGKTVGVKAVQEVISAKNHYGAKNAYVASNRNFSKEAETLANENNVLLINREVLENLIKKYDIHIQKLKGNFSALKESSILEIESKYKFWI